MLYALYLQWEIGQPNDPRIQKKYDYRDLDFIAYFFWLQLNSLLVYFAIS